TYKCLLSTAPMKMRLLWLGHIVNGRQGLLRHKGKQGKGDPNNSEEPEQKLEESFCKILVHSIRDY
ncbi:hypothetical protein K2Q08_01085, partial [Patescibacteria group bacterium]|nr:hypothetical protein [Patescibacteria group bacterium]